MVPSTLRKRPTELSEGAEKDRLIVQVALV